MWKHKLEIDNCSVYILRGKDKNTGHNYRELILGYKTAFINTYTLVVQDLGGIDEENDKRTTLFKHESFQLWESESSGLLLIKNKDFVKISKAGLEVLSLGS